MTQFRAQTQGNTKIAQLLLEAGTGANSNLKNNAGQTAFDLARKIEDENTREKILTLLNQQLAQSENH